MIEWLGRGLRIIVSAEMLRKLGWTNKTGVTIKELSFGILLHSTETVESNSIRIEISETINSLGKDDLLLVLELARRLA